jgi:hypothetical protein
MQLIEFYDFYFEVETEAAKFHHFLKLVNEASLNTFDIEYFDHYYLYSGVFNPEEIIREIKMRPQIDYYKPAKKDILYAGIHDQEKLNFTQQKFRKTLLKDFSLSKDDVEEIIWTMMLDIKNDLSSIKISPKGRDPAHSNINVQSNIKQGTLRRALAWLTALANYMFVCSDQAWITSSNLFLHIQQTHVLLTYNRVLVTELPRVVHALLHLLH